MSESLNRAFIKAYGKGKAAEASRLAAELAQQEAVSNDLIMHFDTATVAVQPPHFLNQRPTALVTADKRTPVQRDAQPLAANQPNEEELLRKSIAEEMLRAGSWGDHSFDTHYGSFQNVEAQATSASETAGSSTSGTGTSGTGTSGTGTSGTGTSGTGTSGTQLDTREDTREPSQTHNPKSGDSARETIEHDMLSNNSVSRKSDPPHQDSPQAKSPIGSLKEKSSNEAETAGSANSDMAINEETIETVHLNDLSSPGSQSQLVKRPKAMHKPGEIVRLDTPVSLEPESTTAPFEGESAFEENSASNQATNHSTANSAASKPKIDSVRGVEENLRKARMKVFNPVWEVDHLQWPEICKELISGSTHAMTRVAQNLTSACEEGLQVLGVTSPQSGEGSTTVACCLAMLAGRNGLNVAIVDANIESPAISFQTNLDVEQDWRSALLNDLPLEEVAVHSIDDQVTLIPLLNSVNKAESYLPEESIAMMLQELSESFDLVIVDMGNMSTSHNLVTQMGGHGVVHAAVAVIDYRSSTKERIETCLKNIRNSGIASVGLVENFAA